MVAGLIAAIAVAGSGSARAQVSIFTPPLSAGTNYQTIVCRATNTDTVGQFVTLNLRSADNGQGGTPTVLPLLPGETGEISFIGFSNAYCEITANTATIADKIVTGIYVLDFSNGGVSTGGLPGARILPGGGTAQRTSSVEATNAQALGCQVVNVGGTSQTVTTAILDDAGGILAGQTTTLASMAGFLVSTAAGPIIGRCEATASTAGLAKNLRVSMFAKNPGIFFTTSAPLAGALRP